MDPRFFDVPAHPLTSVVSSKSFHNPRYFYLSSGAMVAPISIVANTAIAPIVQLLVDPPNRQDLSRQGFSVIAPSMKNIIKIHSSEMGCCLEGADSL